MHLRPATDHDLEPLLRCMVAFNDDDGIDFSADAGRAPLEKLLGDPSLGFAHVAESGDELVGYGVLAFGYDLEFGGRDAFLTEIFVRDDQRGGGLGERLLAAIEARAASLGVLAIHLAVRPSNEAALRLYRRRGFDVVPRALMSKRLRPT
jgi:ribosomal protein S18 acetylase RimI-like enzyme